MEPEFNKVANISIANVTVANVDCQADNKLCSKLGIHRYPRIRFYRNGILISTYTQDFNHREMLEFGEKLSLPPIRFISPKDLQNVLSKNEERSRSILIFFGSELNVLYKRLAYEFYSSLTLFYFVQYDHRDLKTSQQLADFENVFAKLKITDIPLNSSLLVSTSNATRYTHHLRLYKNTTYESLQFWFSVRQYAFLTHFSVSLSRQAMSLGPRRKMVIGLVNGTESSESIQFLKAYESVAVEHFENEEFFFVVVDMNRFPKFAHIYNISSSDSVPDFFVINWATSTNWTSHLIQSFSPSSSSSSTLSKPPFDSSKAETLWTRERMLAFLMDISAGTHLPSDSGGAHFGVMRPSAPIPHPTPTPPPFILANKSPNYVPEKKEL